MIGLTIAAGPFLELLPPLLIAGDEGERFLGVLASEYLLLLMLLLAAELLLTMISSRILCLRWNCRCSFAKGSLKMDS